MNADRPTPSLSAPARTAQLRQRQIAGLLLLGLFILIVSLSRAHWHDLFPPGWWRFW